MTGTYALRDSTTMLRRNLRHLQRYPGLSLASQLAPDAGTLTVAPGAHVGLLPQEDHWNPNRTPADVLGAWDLDQIRATGLLLGADLGRRFGQLSVGQRRRAALACVLLNRPSVLLLDEPTNHLSVTLVDELCDALLSTPAAVVLVTHDRTLRHMVHDWPTVTLSQPGCGAVRASCIARPAFSKPKLR
jgi:macrolide transport system ATP-binding/permease protein